MLLPPLPSSPPAGRLLARPLSGRQSSAGGFGAVGGCGGGDCGDYLMMRMMTGRKIEMPFLTAAAAQFRV